MSNASFDKSSRVSKVWIALRRLDKNGSYISIITTPFGLNSSDVIFKIRNHRGCLIPLNNSIPANSKHMPYVLEVAKIFQHVHPKPRIIPMTVINKSMKTRLQTIDRRFVWTTKLTCQNMNLDSSVLLQIQRLEDLLPQIKLRRNEKLGQEIECLNQKLRFLQRRMQVADSHSWKGVLTRAPLW
ncbi:uncharacterized protein si:zfos-1056e6.1 isoform X2 [Lates calcarifer]|uniref:Uncharacterized protein si:zfos-1056e6.1 isoform X2 n=1 Tax=Lates calcarifer TaxID=8187 RepID=A0AAJ8BKD1_LATCA|nr:uncharacterized protein si:zfos-1056e6.1 isoform X2 [Lates calcarifer]